MENTTIVIIGLIAAVIILAIALVAKSNGINNTDDSIEAEAESLDKEKTGIILADNSVVAFSDIDELVLNNSLGQEIVLKKPSELSDKTYKEIDISGAGKAMQHIGQGSTPIIQKTYTMRQLSEQAKNGLFTSTISKGNLHRYKGDGTFSSIVWKGNKIDAHHGFKEVELASVAGTSPVVLYAIAMQGMAIISGQYYLKQIANNLNSLKKSIDDIKNIHESEARGVLMNCRERLQQIAQMNHCSDVELNEIRSLTNDARKIYEQYKERYLTAYKQVQGYYFKGLSSDSALKTYNELIINMRYLLQVCMIADRVVDEALLTEFVTRRKIDINDPALEDLYNQMDRHYHEGFNANLYENYDDYFGNLLLKGQRIRDAGLTEMALFSSAAKEEMLLPVKDNLSGLREDVERVTASTRRAENHPAEEEEVLMMIDEETGTIRMFEPA